MKRTDMSNYMRLQMWSERILETVTSWEELQGIKVSDDIKDSILEFLMPKVEEGIEKNNLASLFMRIAISSLLYIKTKRWNK